MRFYNPWKKIAGLEAENERLMRRIAEGEREREYLDRMATEAVGRAAEYYSQRYAQEIRARESQTQQLQQILSMAPTLVTVPEGLFRK